MAKCEKVAISLPGEVLQVVEAERKARKESRSQYFRRAVETLLKQEKSAAAVKDYIAGYRRFPESVEEVEMVHRMGIAELAEESWD